MAEQAAERIPAGSSVFLDASVIYFHLVEVTGQPSRVECCHGLIRRIYEAKIAGHTVAAAVSDAMHKVMLAEPRRRFGRPPTLNAHRLNEKPEWLRQLTAHELVLADLRATGVRIHALTQGILADASRMASRYGLLTNDAIIVATMQRLGIEWLATNDDDFDRVPWVKTWKPAITETQAD